MLKVIGGVIAGVVLSALLASKLLGSMVFSEVPSPYTVEETTARIQQNIQAAGNGWTISGLRNPAKPVEADGGNVLPVLLIEACSTVYSGPILKMDDVRFLSLLMPCKISVYKKNDGKVYIGLLNAGFVAKLFSSEVGAIMDKVVADQKKFLIMDPSKPAPALIVPKMGGEGGSGGGAGAAAGC